MSTRLELLIEREGDRLRLRSPEVGYFTRAAPQGALLGPKASAGCLHALGRSIELVLPAGASGRVVNAAPEAVLSPVGYGTILYELAPLASDLPNSPASCEQAVNAARGASALVFRATHSGRFWLRPAPNDPPFAEVGSLITEGTTLGLIEVMKTFTHVAYRGGGELPSRARLVRFLVDDGAEVKDGTPLAEIDGA